MYLKISKALLGLVIVLSLIIQSCNDSSLKNEPILLDSTIAQGELIIYHAGSMTTPLKSVFSEFSKKYPYIQILSQATGSSNAAIEIAEQRKKCDIIIASDYSVIENLLIPKHAKYQISFATNELVLAYNEKSMFVDSVNSKNWYRVLLHDDVQFGRADPDTDPCGYRTVICIKLSELYYNDYGIKDLLLFKNKQYIKPKDIDLLASLNKGEIDYAFIYKSLAQDMNLDYIELPDQINLKSDEYSDYYSKVKVKISGQTPGKYLVQKGAPIRYAIAPIKDCSNPRAAKAFVEFFVDKKEGIKILKKSYLPILDSLVGNPIDSIPKEILIQL